MARALSLDLRERVIAAIEAGASCGQAAERFGVAKASAIRWQVQGSGPRARSPPSRWTATGTRTGPKRMPPLILRAYAARPQIYLREVKDALEENGATASLSGLSRFFRRHGITRKKGISTPPNRAARM